jgi:hypothetical protein
VTHGQGSKAKSVSWTHVPPGHFKIDHFPNVAGPKGSVDTQPTQMQVLKRYAFRNHGGDLLKAFLLLYPGDIKAHVEKVSARMIRTKAKTAKLTVGEWVVFLSLLTGATLQREAGHALWDPVPERPFRRGHPGYGDYMTRRRFDEIKASCTAAFTDEEKEGTDKWFQIRPAVDAFNAN